MRVAINTDSFVASAAVIGFAGSDLDGVLSTLQSARSGTTGMGGNDDG